MISTHYHPLYGISIPEIGWVPTPQYIMRRNRVLSHTNKKPQNKLLEIGCGTGALLHDFREQGFECVGLETSPKAFNVSTEIHADSENVTICNEKQSNWNKAFSCVVALEVLEHIEDDIQALKEWKDWMVPGGKLILSVPAHQKKWNNNDIYAGHFRRYDYKDLTQVLESSGFKIEVIEGYGFPLSNMLLTPRSWYHGRKLKKQQNDTIKELTDNSALDRSLESKLYPIQKSILGTMLMKAALHVQNRFLHTQLSTCFLAVATNP